MDNFTPIAEDEDEDARCDADREDCRMCKYVVLEKQTNFENNLPSYLYITLGMPEEGFELFVTNVALVEIKDEDRKGYVYTGDPETGPFAKWHKLTDITAEDINSNNILLHQAEAINGEVFQFDSKDYATIQYTPTDTTFKQLVYAKSLGLVGFTIGKGNKYELAKEELHLGPA